MCEHNYELESTGTNEAGVNYTELRSLKVAMEPLSLHKVRGRHRWLLQGGLQVKDNELSHV